MNIPVSALIAGITALVAVGFTIGAYGSRFITRVEFKESIDRLHERIDEVLKKINDLNIKVAKINGINDRSIN